MFELQQDAMAMAEFEAARYYEDYEFDDDNDCWTVRDCRDRKFRLVIEPLSDSRIAA